MISVAGLTHDYGQRRALDDVGFEVAEGEVFGLLGPNGGGKTTLFRIACTLMAPTAGSVRIGGSGDPREVRRRIGVVFQSPSLDRKLTAFENLRHQGHLYGLGGADLRRRAHEMLAQVGLLDRAHERVEGLSGGLRRRVELAKGLLSDPDVLLLDEPSTGLDPGARLDLWTHLRRTGVTSLLTTHLMEEAERCDRLGVLDRGRLVGLGTPAELKARIGGDVVTIAATDPDDLRAEIEARFGPAARVVDGKVRLERKDGHAFLPQLAEAFPDRIESVAVGRPTLEDVFVHLTGHRFWSDRA